MITHESCSKKELLDYLQQDMRITQELYNFIQNSIPSFPMKAWVLKLVPEKIKVVCESCHRKGKIDTKCPVCGGKGTHNKTQLKWVVSNTQTDIVKIDRDPETGGLRYWTDMSCFFPETIEEFKRYYDPFHSRYPYGAHVVHFNHPEAVTEANRLNMVLKERGALV